MVKQKFQTFRTIPILRNFCSDQGRNQNLKEVPQNYTDVFNVDDVTANDVIQRKQHRKEKKKTSKSSIVITDVKLRS